MTVTEYIKTNWPKCIRENKEDNGSLIGLPFPYTVPCISGAFQEMYYWDTYFINRGLILIGLTEQAINNTENMFSLIERYGFMPNGNRTGYLNNTQPPFLSEMVKDIYNETSDKIWLKKALHYLIKEYEFWDNNRNTEIELSQYMGNFKQVDLKQRANGFIGRIKKRPDGISDEKLGLNYLIACESGWDISPRFGFDAENFIQIDLNSLLCAMERNIAFFLSELNEENELWTKRYEKRLELINKYMQRDGVFYDYNFKTGKTGDVFSCVSLYPMWLGLSSPEQAEKTVKELPRLENAYGLSACEDVPSLSEYTFQWGYPNGWAPMHLIAVEGLLKYGYKEKALEIAQKYVTLVERSFEETHNLWEKYNVVDGSINVAQENDHKTMPAMLGWSAGVYLYAKSLFEQASK